MVDELLNPNTNSTPVISEASEEYEYEYIELKEGEALPDDAEYEYEYVEVEEPIAPVVPVAPVVSVSEMMPIVEKPVEQLDDNHLLELTRNEESLSDMLQDVAMKDVIIDIPNQEEEIDLDKELFGMAAYDHVDSINLKAPSFEEISPFIPETRNEPFFESEPVVEAPVVILEPVAVVEPEPVVEAPVVILEPVVVVEPEPVIETPVVIPEPVAIVEPEPVVEAPVVIPEPVAVVEPEPVVEAPVVIPEPVAIVEPEPVVEAPVVISEPVAVVEPEPVVEAPVVIPEPVAVVEPEPVVEAPVVIPEPVAVVEPEPVVETPIVIPEPVAVVEPEVDTKEPIIDSEIIDYKVYALSEEIYQSYLSNSKIFNKLSGITKFQADEKVKSVIIDNVDYAKNELESWGLTIFKKTMVKLTPQAKEIDLPMEKNTVRYAHVIKNGCEELKLFDETKFNFMASTAEFVKIKGHFIYGQVDYNTGMIIDDFINISLNGRAGQLIIFATPVSGILTGPNNAKLYFNDLGCLLIPSAISATLDEEKQQIKNAKWYSGSLNDKYFELSATNQTTEFNGNDEIKAIHVNVGSSTYGWNVTFDNGIVMSFRDMQEFQTKHGALPAHNGTISHGQLACKFTNIEKIVVYETAQYFAYGRV